MSLQEKQNSKRIDNGSLCINYLYAYIYGAMVLHSMFDQ